jgi:lactate dehydrogenase-like 2-hydroxyacid dehydrogenase
MSPIAIDFARDASVVALKPVIPRKPRVFSLEPLHSRALTLAREKFELVLPTDQGFEAWRSEAEGLLARNAEVTASDTRVLKDNKLRYIAKQGVGVDNFDLDELTKCGIPLMNTPGVNVSRLASLLCL